jgi:hypothetical protein
LVRVSIDICIFLPSTPYAGMLRHYRMSVIGG